MNNKFSVSSIFIEHDFNVLEDVWFTLAPNLTVQSIEVSFFSIFLLAVMFNKFKVTFSLFYYVVNWTFFLKIVISNIEFYLSFSDFNGKMHWIAIGWSIKRLVFNTWWFGFNKRTSEKRKLKPCTYTKWFFSLIEIS